MTALEAKSRAQTLAFAPFAFQATVALRDLGILAAVGRAGPDGLDRSEIAAETGVSEYGVSVLLDFGVDLGLVTCTQQRFALDDVGYFVLHDEMTAVNMDFTRDVCYHALGALTESIRNGQPEGLSALGEWPTIYEGLTHLPEPALSSWYRFDHFYSDRAYDELLPLVFRDPVRHVLDIGGNTGRWSLKCLRHDPDVTVTIVDLPAQLDAARRNIEQAGFGARVDYHEADLLDPTRELPAGADVLWMSQFLDCFSEAEVTSILARAARAMDTDARLYIVELFPDRQVFDAARFSLDATSLYFTCVANGTSRMYHSDRFRELVNAAGLTIERTIDHVGEGHTLLCCARI